MFIVYAYFAYLAISLTVTVWVARTLHRRGRIFLVDAFQGQVELADSVNHLLVVGFLPDQRGLRGVRVEDH